MAAILLVSMISLLIAHGTKRRQSLNLLPELRGVPILGYLPFLTTLPHKKIAELAHQYGPLMFMPLGSFPFLVISSREMIREVMVTQDHIFGSHPQSTLVNRVFGKLGLNGLGISAIGPGSQNLRRLYTHHVQSPRMVESFEPIRSGEMKDMVRRLWEDGKGGSSVDLNRAVLEMATNITTLTLLKKWYLGKNIENEKESHTFERILDSLFNYFIAFHSGDCIPFLQPVEALLFNAEQKFTDLAIDADAFVQNAIDQHQRQLNSVSTDSVTDQVNLLDELLKYQGKDGQYLNNQIILEILVAANDGPWVVTEWAMAELLCHPKIMQKLQEELDAVEDTSRLVVESDLPNVVMEDFRLHPSGPLLIPHESTQAIQIAEYDIPAQTRVLFNIWAMARDPSVWDRPTEFDPERFLHLTDMDKLDQKLKFLPWGLGRRSCVGMRTGSLTVNLALAHLEHSFNWSSCEALDMREKSDGLKVPMKVPLSHLLIKACLPKMNCTQALNLSEHMNLVYSLPLTFYSPGDLKLVTPVKS